MPADDLLDTGGRPLVQGFAKVVAADAATVWLEPEQISACGACASAAACGMKSSHSDRRLKTRRFVLPNDQHLAVGQRVVIGISEYALIRASWTAYAVPLLTMMAAAVAVQQSGGSDLATMAAAAAGLAVGLLVARWKSNRLSARGDMAPKFLRLARPGETLHNDCG